MTSVQFNTKADPFYPAGPTLQIVNVPTGAQTQLEQLIHSVVGLPSRVSIQGDRAIVHTPSPQDGAKLTSKLLGYSLNGSVLQVEVDAPKQTTLPPFLIDLVKGRTDSDLIEVEADGERLRVNPRRLFVGNIPFKTTWPTLRNFLTNKADELDPNNKIEIVRVEIPMHTGPPQTSRPTERRALESDVPFASPSRGMSRGFAIVTTKNKHLLDELIRLFDNIDFEGRSLTVRYDKFPDFNAFQPPPIDYNFVPNYSYGYPYAMYYPYMMPVVYPVPEPVEPEPVEKRPPARRRRSRRRVDRVDQRLDDEKARELVTSFQQLGL